MKQKHFQTLCINIVLIIKVCFFLTMSHNKPDVKPLYYHFNDKKMWVRGEMLVIPAAEEFPLHSTHNLSRGSYLAGDRETSKSNFSSCRKNRSVHRHTNRSHYTSHRRNTLTSCCLSYCFGVTESQLTAVSAAVHPAACFCGKQINPVQTCCSLNSDIKLKKNG